MSNKTNWKDELGSFFAGRGIYRIDYLNKELIGWLKEYADYLNTFHEVKSVFSAVYENIDGTGAIECGELTVASRIDGLFMHHMEFRITCAFNKDSHLRLFYADDYELGVLVSNEYLDPREYSEDILDEPERFEKGYVLQLITNRLSRYIEKVSGVKLGCN